MGVLRVGTGAASLVSKPVRVEVPRSDRLTLRALALSDRQAYIDVLRRSRAELDAFAPLHREGESDEALFERHLHMTQDGERSGQTCRRIGVLDDGRIAGAFNLNAISRGIAWRADLNYWVASDLAGRGLATEGVRMLVAHAVTPLPRGLGLHVIEAGVKPDHVASVRVLTKTGFERSDQSRTQLRTGTDWALHDIYAFEVSSTG